MTRQRFITIVLLICASRTFGQATEYTVEKGDTLYAIAHEYGISLDILMKANGIDDPTTLSVGTKIVIPHSYRAVKGDTLWKIAHSFSVTVGELRALNGLSDDYVLRTGDVLKIPGLAISEQESTPIQEQEIAAVEPSKTVTEQSVPAPESGTTPFWPVSGARTARQGKFTGTEILGKPGDIVYAVADGVVVWNAPYRGYGRVVIVESANDYLYLYGGSEVVSVELREQVSAGAEIGQLGVDPNTGEARLIFAVLKNGKIIDPELAPRG